MKSLLLLVAIFSLAYGQSQVVLTTDPTAEDVPIVVTEGSNVTFQCQISGAAITPQVRPPGGTFGSSFPANLMFVEVLGEVTFTVVNAQRSENSTAFQCGAGGDSTNIGVLNVYYPPSYVNPGDQTFTEGQMNAGVDVGLDANPIGDFSWTRNGMPITADNVWLTASNITFNPVRRENEGSYTIFGNNTAGSNSTTFQVTVNFIPQFEAGLGSLQCRGSNPITCAIMTGADGTLQCSAVGSPPTTVTPDNGASTTNNVQFMNNQFTITSAVSGNAGIYSCNASNSVGYTERTFQLWVGGAPTLNSLSLTVDSPNLMISWIFDAMGVPISSFNVTVVCQDQSTTDSPPVPMMGNQVNFTRSLAPYPAGAICTVTVGASNLLGPSNNLINAFTTPAGTPTVTSQQSAGTPTVTTQQPAGTSTVTTQQPADSTAAIVGGVVAALLAVFVITVIILVVVFVAVRRYYRHSDKLNIHSRPESVKLSEESVGDNEGITTTGESTRQQDTEHISTKQCSAYGIVPGTDGDNIEYETLESEHISTQQCGAYGVVPETDADNIILYEN